MSTTGSFGKRAASGATYMGMAQAVSVGTAIINTVIVARLLSPDDYGVVAMVAPVTAFLLLFRNLGLNHAAVQARELTDSQSNSLFWINMAASAAITLVLLGLAPVVAWFYSDPRPGYITAASALTVMAGGSALQHVALLNREMRFGTLSLIDILSSFMTVAATVAAALILKSYWALWLGAFIATIFSNILTWRSSGWRPSWRISFRGVGNMVKFGGALTGFNLINFLHRNLDNVLIGKVWGPGQLGLYDRSYRLMMFPLQNINAPLGRVILPVLSRMQDEPERYRRSFLLTVRSIMLVTIPPLGVAAATSDRLVPFLLGERWAEAAPIFFWLSLAAFVQPVGNSTGWLFISSGRPGALLRWGAFYTLIMSAGYIYGVQFGAVGVAKAYFLVSASLTPVLFIYCSRNSPIRPIDLFAICIPPYLTAALAWVMIDRFMSEWEIIPLLIVAIPFAYAACLASLWLTPGGRETVRLLASLGFGSLSSLLKRRRAA